MGFSTKFWAMALSAMCARARLAADPVDDNVSNTVRERYSRALAISERAERRTFRSICILIWLLEDLRRPPIADRSWSSDLLSGQLLS